VYKRQFEDRTRALEGNAFWETPAEIVESAAQQYRVDAWAAQPFRPEVWVEKDALTGILEPTCRALHVPWFSCRGYSSQSAMWRAGATRMAAYIRANQVPVVFQFSDHDPSGLDMHRDVRERLSLFAGRDVRVIRLGLTMDQVREAKAPPDPAKVSDSRAPAYIAEHGDKSWELDALEPAYIAELVETHVGALIRERKWKKSMAAEKRGRATLRRTAKGMQA